MRSPCCLSEYLPNFCCEVYEITLLSVWVSPEFLLEGLWDRLPVCLSISLIFVVRLMRSPCCLSEYLPNLCCEAYEITLLSIWVISRISVGRPMRSPCCLCVPLSLLGNGPSTWVFPNLFVFYAVLVISKETRQEVLPRTSCYSWSLWWLCVRTRISHFKIAASNTVVVSLQLSGEIEDRRPSLTICTRTETRCQEMSQMCFLPRYHWQFHTWRQVRQNWRAATILCLLPDSCWFLALLTLQPWRWKQHVPSERRLTFAGLHGVISQKITTAVRAWGIECVHRKHVVRLVP
jgi:hypothetical protein